MSKEKHEACGRRCSPGGHYLEAIKEARPSSVSRRRSKKHCVKICNDLCRPSENYNRECQCYRVCCDNGCNHLMSTERCEIRPYDYLIHFSKHNRNCLEKRCLNHKVYVSSPNQCSIGIQCHLSFEKCIEISNKIDNQMEAITKPAECQIDPTVDKFLLNIDSHKSESIKSNIEMLNKINNQIESITKSSQNQKGTSVNKLLSNRESIKNDIEMSTKINNQKENITKLAQNRKNPSVDKFLSNIVSVKSESFKNDIEMSNKINNQKENITKSAQNQKYASVDTFLSNIDSVKSENIKSEIQTHSLHLPEYKNKISSILTENRNIAIKEDIISRKKSQSISLSFKNNKDKKSTSMNSRSKNNESDRSSLIEDLTDDFKDPEDKISTKGNHIEFKVSEDSDNSSNIVSDTNTFKKDLEECEKIKQSLIKKLSFKENLITDLQRQIKLINQNKSLKFEDDENISFHLKLTVGSQTDNFNFISKSNKDV